MSDLVDFFLIAYTSCRLWPHGIRRSCGGHLGHVLLVFDFQTVADKNGCWNRVRGETLLSVLFVGFSQLSADLSCIIG